jgi:hypothetical protein
MFLATVWLRDFDCTPLDEGIEVVVNHWCGIQARRMVREAFPDALDIEIHRV